MTEKASGRRRERNAIPTARKHIAPQITFTASEDGYTSHIRAPGCTASCARNEVSKPRLPSDTRQRWIGDHSIRGRQRSILVNAASRHKQLLIARYVHIAALQLLEAAGIRDLRARVAVPVTNRQLKSYPISTTRHDITPGLCASSAENRYSAQRQALFRI